MRVLIVAAVLACASAAPSGLLADPCDHDTPLAYGYATPLAVEHAAPLAAARAASLAVAHATPLATARATPLAAARAAPMAVAHATPLATARATSLAAARAAPLMAAARAAPLAAARATPLAVAHATPMAVARAAIPTISYGDIQGATIDAHEDAFDHVRTAVDANRQLHDRDSELLGQAINAVEDHSWHAVDAVKTHDAQLDGAIAGAAPSIAKQLAGRAGVYAAAPALAHSAYAAPVLAHSAYAAPIEHAAHIEFATPIEHAAPIEFANPIVHASPYSFSTQTLYQTHPAPLMDASSMLAHAASVAYADYGHAGLAHVELGDGLAQYVVDC